MPAPAPSALAFWIRRAAIHAQVLRDIRQTDGSWVALRALAQASASYLGVLGRRILSRSTRPPPRPPAECRLDPAEGGRPPHDSVLFAGYVEASLGLGQSLRGLIGAAARQRIPFAVFPYSFRVEQRVSGPFLPETYDVSRRHLVNVVEIAADQSADFLTVFGRERLSESHTILRTYWELAQAPAEWRPALAVFDEIWAPSRFVADSLASVFQGPISLIPPAVNVVVTQAHSRADFGLAEGIRYFIFTCDLNSYPARKNPLAVIRAFRLAFPDPAAAVGLVVKFTSSHGVFEEYKAAIRLSAAQDPRVVLFESEMSRDEIISLMNACDAYVSLHRSEGLGLGMIEAMMLGKAVIATDYSGSRDYLSDETGFPVRYELAPVRPHEYPHAGVQSWAEPDVAHAAQLMAALHADGVEAGRRAAAGRAFVNARYGPDAAGLAMKQRIEAIFAERGRPYPP